MPSWHTVIDEDTPCPGGGQRYRRVGMATLGDGAVQASWPGAQGVLQAPPAKAAASGRRRAAAADADVMTAPMAARVIAVHVQAGDTAAAGAPLVVLEAMKMEHTVRASHSRRVADCHVAPGDSVAQGQPLVTFAVAAVAP